MNSTSSTCLYEVMMPSLWMSSYACITTIKMCDILINTLRPRAPAFRRPSRALLLKALSGTSPPQKPDCTKNNQTSTPEDENRITPKLCRSKNSYHDLSIKQKSNKRFCSTLPMLEQYYRDTTWTWSDLDIDSKTKCQLKIDIYLFF